ncbi:ANTAR domain-containing response regulator [Streptomyces sp. NPDC054864]
MTLTPEKLAVLFAELMELAATDPLDTQRVLRTCTRSGRRIYGSHGALVRYRPCDGSAGQTDGTSTALQDLAADALAWNEGPGHDAQAAGCPLVDVDVTAPGAQALWPRWAPRAAALHYGRVTALPLAAHGSPVGALVLLGAPGSTPAGEQLLACVHSLASVTAHALSLQRKTLESRAEAAQLQGALTSRVLIEQAKGALAARHGLTTEEAFRLLRQYARSHRRKAAEVARDVIDGRIDLSGQADTEWSE